jgi:hypothetical protein
MPRKVIGGDDAAGTPPVSSQGVVPVPASDIQDRLPGARIARIAVRLSLRCLGPRPAQRHETVTEVDRIKPRKRGDLIRRRSYFAHRNSLYCLKFAPAGAANNCVDSILDILRETIAVTQFKQRLLHRHGPLQSLLEQCRCLLGREVDPGGPNAWTALADRDANINVVLERFVESPEFAARTASDDQLLAAANLLRMNDCDPHDIFVVGYPKSGNTWMQHLLAGLVFGIEPRLCPDSLVRDLVPDVRFSKFYKRYLTPTFFKTHDLPEPKHRRVIYLFVMAEVRWFLIFTILQRLVSAQIV